MAAGLVLCWERSPRGLIPADRRLLFQLLMPHFKVWPSTGYPVHYSPELHLLGDAPGQGWFLLPCYSQGGLINSTGSAPLPVRVAAAKGQPWTGQVVKVAEMAVSLLGKKQCMERVRGHTVRAEPGNKGRRHCSLCPQSSPALHSSVIC